MKEMIFWGVVCLISDVFVWEICVEYMRRLMAREVKKAEQRGFLEGISGERRFHEKPTTAANE